MRNDKIFRKRSVLEGCYSTQPGSRLMTSFARKGEYLIKYVLVGVGGVMGGSAQAWPCGPQPQNQIPSFALLQLELPTTGSGRWMMNALMRDALPYSARCRAVNGFFDRSTSRGELGGLACL